MANYSILDLVPITEGSDATTALERSKELAILAGKAENPVVRKDMEARNEIR